jgi:hypothetical protein
MTSISESHLEFIVTISTLSQIFKRPLINRKSTVEPYSYVQSHDLYPIPHVITHRANAKDYYDIYV